LIGPLKQLSGLVNEVVKYTAAVFAAFGTVL